MSQITRTTPLRLTILHLSHIFFTDARTFIKLPLHGCFHHIRVSISGPLSVMATVCSKWADNPPSHVTTVQLSSRTLTSCDFSLIIGSIASTIPGLSLTPLPE